MGKRTERGMSDPFLTKRVPRRHGKYAQTGYQTPRKDLDADARRINEELKCINREYLDKELALSVAVGPHSTPEQSYPKSFRIKKEGP